MAAAGHCSLSRVSRTQKLAEEVAKSGEDTINDQAREYFKRMEDGDAEALALWTRFRELSIRKYREIYARLNISFDVYSGESQYGEAMKSILQELIDKSITKDDDGATLIELGGNLGKVVVRKKNGPLSHQCMLRCARLQLTT